MNTNLSREELEREAKHLDETICIIREIIKEKNVNIEEYKRSIIEEKKYIYENQHEFKEAELYNAYDEKDLSTDLVNKDIKKVYRLYRSLENPYFSRIDFKSGDREESFYIGLSGIEKDMDILVYDWRANVANLYYNYGVGRAKYKTSDGELQGEITLKRNFLIERGKLVNVYDSKREVYDRILESILNNNTSDVMKNIVGTIGREQNEIIRYPNSHLIVEGVAGSGKTSVALHRIAYILYNQKNLNYKNVLIFSPSEVFSHYISNVLPELGEENVATTTFNDFASNYIKNVRIEPLSDFIEKFYENKLGIDETIKYKFSLDFKRDLDKFLEKYFDDVVFTKKIGLKKKELSAKELNELKASVPRSLKFHDRLEYLSEKITNYFGLDERKHAPKFYDIILKLLDIKKNPLELYLLATGTTIEKSVMYEDICGLLYLYFEIHGYPNSSEVKFVIIDEAQDYSKWQFEFIRSIFNSAKFTILGDVNQAINPYLKYNSLSEISYVFKNPSFKRLEFTYRSSREIMEYASSILGLSCDNIVRGNFGIPVRNIETENIKDTINEVVLYYKSFSFRRIAVITKTKGEADFIKSLEIPDVLVLPVYVSKGLEFDGIIIYTDKENYFNDDDANIFYVAVTRALHGVTLINQR